MKTANLRLLKKLTLEDIQLIRNMYRDGINIEILAKTFNVCKTTISWHLAELETQDYIKNVL